jgi:glycine/D-amino acid oxidase-like deaminating enzyme
MALGAPGTEGARDRTVRSRPQYGLVPWFEPDYPPRVFRTPELCAASAAAYELWRETEQLTKEQLLFVTGGIDAGAEDSRIVQGALAACREHDLPHQVLTARETTQRFPGYKLPDQYAVIYQPDAGFVASERAILAHASLAVAAGAESTGVRRCSPLSLPRGGWWS